MFFDSFYVRKMLLFIVIYFRFVESYTETTFNITLTIKTCTSLSPREGMKVQLEAVTSLLTTFREWSAMISFSQHNLLDKDILRPRGVKYFCSDDKPNDVTGNEVVHWFGFCEFIT